MRSFSGALMLLSCTALFAQDVRPIFDAASIRPVAPPVGPFMPGTRPVCPLNGCGGPGTGSPERITFTFITLKQLIQTAYDARDYQVDGPGWMASATFDVVANIPAGATREQAMLMLQNLLADRFQLTFHRSTSEVPIYALVAANGGPKLTAAANDPTAAKPRGTMSAPGGGKRFEFNGMTMAGFAGVLEHDVDRPVVDMTGVEGTYDIRLTFAPQRPVGPPGGGQPPTPSPDLPGLFTALAEQLGLRLESRRGPVTVLVVDSALRQPTEN